jgi:hypothetical protein
VRDISSPCLPSQQQRRQMRLAASPEDLNRMKLRKCSLQVLVLVCKFCSGHLALFAAYIYEVHSDSHTTFWAGRHALARPESTHPPCCASHTLLRLFVFVLRLGIGGWVCLSEAIWQHRQHTHVIQSCQPRVVRATMKAVARWASCAVAVARQSTTAHPSASERTGSDLVGTSSSASLFNRKHSRWQRRALHNEELQAPTVVRTVGATKTLRWPQQRQR